MSGIFESIILLNSCADVSALFDVYSSDYIEYQRKCAISKTVYDIMKLDNKYIFYTGENRDFSITFSVKKQTMSFAAYGLESTANTYSSSCSWAYPTSWEIFGSNDNKKWSKITSKSENNDLNTRNEMSIYNLSQTYIFKYVRLDAHTSFPENYGVFGLSRFELYGDPISDTLAKKIKFESCKKSNSNYNKSVYIVYIIILY